MMGTKERKKMIIPQSDFQRQGNPETSSFPRGRKAFDFLATCTSSRQDGKMGPKTVFCSRDTERTEENKKRGFVGYFGFLEFSQSGVLRRLVTVGRRAKFGFDEDTESTLLFVFSFLTILYAS